MKERVFLTGRMRLAKVVDMELCMAFLGEAGSVSLMEETNLGKGYRANAFSIFKQWPGMPG